MNTKKVDYKNSWKNWGEDFKIYGPSSRHTRRMIKKYMDLVEFNSIIDIGCGTGIFLNSLDLKNKKFAGIDISVEGIKFCKKKLKKGNFQVMDIEKQCPKEKYDLGICSEVLEHVKDDVKAMKNLRKLCKKIVISVPTGKFGQDDYEMGHYRRYSVKEMTKKLKIAGFKIIKYEKWGFPFYSPIYRFFINKTSEDQRVGKVGIIKRIVSESVNLLFYLNIKNKGDRLFLLAE